jgi:hypothetical protein
MSTGTAIIVLFVLLAFYIVVGGAAVINSFRREDDLTYIERLSFLAAGAVVLGNAFNIIKDIWNL